MGHHFRNPVFYHNFFYSRLFLMLIVFLRLTAKVTYMKRLGFRAALVSTEEKVGARTKRPQTTENTTWLFSENLTYLVAGYNCLFFCRFRMVHYLNSAIFFSVFIKLAFLKCLFTSFFNLYVRLNASCETLK